MVRLNLSLDDVRNCEETTKFVKECEKIIEWKKKGIKVRTRTFSWKIAKALEKYPKLEVVINFKWF